MRRYVFSALFLSVFGLHSPLIADEADHFGSNQEASRAAEATKREMCASAFSPVFDSQGRQVYTMVLYHYVTSTGALGKNVSLTPGVFVLIPPQKPLWQSTALKLARAQGKRLYGKTYEWGTSLKIQMFSKDKLTRADGVFESSGSGTLSLKDEATGAIQELRTGATKSIGLITNLTSSNTCIPAD